MATAKENAEFTDKIIGDCLLEEAIDWIRTHMMPEEIYGKESEIELEKWAQRNGWEQA